MSFNGAENPSGTKKYQNRNRIQDFPNPRRYHQGEGVPTYSFAIF